MPELPIEPMAARVDQITNAGTWGGAIATAGSAALNWLGANQSGLTVLVMLITGAVTVISAAYGIYHKRRTLQIAERQGFDALRRSDR